MIVPRFSLGKRITPVPWRLLPFPDYTAGVPN